LEIPVAEATRSCTFVTGIPNWRRSASCCMNCSTFATTSRVWPFSVFL
jgi:hypothetical protein